MPIFENFPVSAFMKADVDRERWVKKNTSPVKIGWRKAVNLANSRLPTRCLRLAQSMSAKKHRPD